MLSSSALVGLPCPTHGRMQVVAAALAPPSSLEVQARISAAASTGRLDLSNCGLEEVPSQVFSLTGLVDLSLAGNNITQIQEDIEKLTNLRRLGLAGNWLSGLPANIGKLKHLEGLWVQGNLIDRLPEEIGCLLKLRTFALAGNMLKAVPDSISGLINLQVLSISGNKLDQIIWDIGKLASLKVLALNGNYLRSLPPSLQSLVFLEDLWLQGNQIESLPIDLSGMRSLKQLSVADNHLSYLPESIEEVGCLKSLWLYGNKIMKVPVSVCNLKQLQNIWLEGNPLDAKHIPNSLQSCSHLKAFGVDSLVDFPNALQVEEHKALQVSEIVGTGLAPSLGGYFKLQRPTESSANCFPAEVVVVTFGSAPGVPNWGGLLRRTRSAMVAENIKPAFDILYVVDGRRSWYTENKKGEPMQILGDRPESSLFLDDSSINEPDYVSTTIDGNLEEMGLCTYFQQELKEALRKYRRIVMLGDSMGASAALMFSPLATSVIAFCPQVDLALSSIRPGRGSTWLDIFKKDLLNAVISSSAHITVHCGSWENDLYQARLLPDNKVDLVTHNVDDHRLAKELDAKGSLLRIVKSKIEQEMKVAYKHLSGILSQ